MPRFLVVTRVGAVIDAADVGRAMDLAERLVMPAETRVGEPLDLVADTMLVAARVVQYAVIDSRVVESGCSPLVHPKELLSTLV